MIEDDEQNIILRKRRRAAHEANGQSKNGEHQNEGQANKESSAWGWTRGQNENPNPFAEAPKEEAQHTSQRPSRHEEPTRRRLGYGGPQAPERPTDAVKFPFDPWRFVSALKRRWHWLALGAIVLGALFFVAGNKALKYKVSVNLIRREVTNAMNPNESDPNRPRQLSDQTLYSFMRSGEILRRVAAKAAQANPPIQVSPEQLGSSIGILPTANPDILALSLSGPRRDASLATVANLYAEEVVRYMREVQASESGDVAGYLAQKVEVAQRDWQAASDELARYQKEAGFVNLEKESEGYLLQISNYDLKYETARIDLETVRLQMKGLEGELKKQSPKQDRLNAAQEDLAALLLKFKDAHPEVIAQKKKIEMLAKAESPVTGDGVPMALNSFGNTLNLQMMELKGRAANYEKQLEEYGRLRTLARSNLTGLSDKAQRYAILKANVQAADATRQLVAVRQRDTKLFVDNAMGYYRVYGEASEKDINWKNRALKIGVMTAFGAFAGILMAALLAFFVEASDTRLKTVADIERTTNLPVLATLGDLEKMSATEQINWAFRTLTILRGKLCANPDDALVCGLISSGPGEGRSTWVNLLVSAASQRGLRVLTVDTRPTAEGPRTEPRPPQHPTKPSGSGKKKYDESAPAVPASETDLADNLLAKPMEVARRLKEPEAIVHIPIPGWVWSLERRHQWQEALAQWKEIDNTVILIELPPASHPEAILLAEKLPQLIWLVGSGMADVKETREQMETLRHAHCNIVGAALNHAPPPPLNNRFARWFSRGAAMLALGLGLCVNVGAQEKLSFSGAAQIKRAAWQERLTLGPGDAMDISLYGQPDMTRTNIFVGPDGRISYLQVQGLEAKGLTIDELRGKLDEELIKYFTTARTIIIPTAFVSKKYYVLGKVVSKGAYPLDRPLTIVEAVARAQGLETGLYERHTVEMADLSRSFLIRNGTRQQVDLEKLFLEGDLAQNIAIEPDDFLFFGAASSREIYVLGQVNNPGPLGFVPNATVMTAITDRGGFTERAYRGKVLVIRGSLYKPERFVVDTKDILNAATNDFKLETKDIIYVSQRPWVRAEELADEAMQSFIQGFVTAFTGVKVGPYIKNPVFGN
jgi:protein involved in polysaccharide export with SLBB domain/capsular polysaccharide biosynthesis protein